jgi:S-DNA-T family DNA segregation ATPase FtsK/SpoIIIE
MDAHTLGMLLLGGAGLAIVVWVLHKIGKALLTVVEALAAVAVVFLALRWLLTALVWLFTQIVTRWRTSLTLLALTAWWQWWDWPSLVLTLGVIVLVLAVWRWIDVVSFDTWAGRWLRAWWLRWTIYAPKLPGWLHACGLSITDTTTPVVVTVNLMGRNRIGRDQQQPTIRVPKVLGVRSGASWDEVRIRLGGADTGRLRHRHPRPRLRPGSGPLPDPRTQTQCDLDRFPAPQPPHHPSSLPRPRDHDHPQG